MHACVLLADLRLPMADSLKAKRAVITPILEGSRRRHHVSAAEVDHQDDWHRSELAFATVASSATRATEALDTVERFVWSFPEIEVLDTWRHWVDDHDEERP